MKVIFVRERKSEKIRHTVRYLDTLAGQKLKIPNKISKSMLDVFQF